MSAIPTDFTVLHVLDHSLPLHSGYAFRSQNIVETQQAHGWRPLVLTSPKHEASWAKPLAASELIGGVRYYRSGQSTGRRIPIAAEFALMRKLYKRLVELIETERPHVIHAHSPVLNALPALAAGRRFNIPVVYELRAFWEDAAVDHGSYGNGSLKYKLVQKAETFACRRAAHLAVLCEGIRNELVTRGLAAEQLTIVPNAVDADSFRPGAHDPTLAREWRLTGKRVVGFIGSFYHYEGLDLLVSAVARLRAKQPDLVLLLVGGGAMEQKLRALVQQLEVEDRVVLAGRVPHERVPAVYELVDLLVYPRKSMRLTELVTPLKPLEAMAMHKACLASNVGGHRELIEDGVTGALFSAGDVEALADRIDELVGDASRLQQLGKSGRTWVEAERTWTGLTPRYEHIYSAALSVSQHQLSPGQIVSKPPSSQ